MSEEIFSLEPLGFSKYGITKSGEVYSNYNKAFMKPSRDKRGYYRVKLASDNGIYLTIPIHRLVAKRFIDNPENKSQVDHIDGNKTNNSVSNLRWATNLENAHFAMDTGLMHHAVFKSEDIVRSICERLQNGESVAEISRSTGYSYAAIQAIKLGRNWRHISKEYNIPLYPYDLSRPSPQQIEKLCELIASGATNKTILELLPGVSIDTITRTRSGRIHKSVMEKFNNSR
jgi:hypothetical protein